MVIVVTGVRRGVIVDFDLVTALEVNLSTSDVQKSVINALNSSALRVDLNITSVKGSIPITTYNYIFYAS